MSHYRFIREEQAAFLIMTLCRVLRVSHSGYYAWGVPQGFGPCPSRRGVERPDRGGARVTPPHVRRATGSR